MRKYKNQDENQVLEIYCNCCGKKLKTEKDLVQEGVFPVHMQWGYFSGKDGECHSFDVCEKCYDRWVASFRFRWKRICKMSCCSTKKCVL